VDKRMKKIDVVSMFHTPRNEVKPPVKNTKETQGTQSRRTTSYNGVSNRILEYETQYSPFLINNFSLLTINHTPPPR